MSGDREMGGAVDLMEYGRHLIRRAAASGRWHHQPLSDRDIDRGAKAVVNDPYYRSDIGHVALVWASDHGDAVDTAIVQEALGRLAENDQQSGRPQ